MILRLRFLSGPLGGGVLWGCAGGGCLGGGFFASPSFFVVFFLGVFEYRSYSPFGFALGVFSGQTFRCADLPLLEMPYAVVI